MHCNFLRRPPDFDGAPDNRSGSNTCSSVGLCQFARCPARFVKGAFWDRGRRAIERKVLPLGYGKIPFATASASASQAAQSANAGLGGRLDLLIGAGLRGRQSSGPPQPGSTPKSAGASAYKIQARILTVALSHCASSIDDDERSGCHLIRNGIKWSLASTDKQITQSLSVGRDVP